MQSKQTMDNYRFNDAHKMLFDFGDTVLVKCPKCSKAIDYKIDLNNSANVMRMVCVHCGYIRDAYTIDIKKEFYKLLEPKYELFLSAECCSNIFWAKNKEHLLFLESYIRATLRERSPYLNRSLASRLPAWMTSAKNRKEVLKCIEKLKKMV
jgi:Zn ribbon nucleic-acid-binding protein